MNTTKPQEVNFTSLKPINFKRLNPRRIQCSKLYMPSKNARPKDLCYRIVFDKVDLSFLDLSKKKNRVIPMIGDDCFGFQVVNTNDIQDNELTVSHYECKNERKSTYTVRIPCVPEFEFLKDVPKYLERVGLRTGRIVFRKHPKMEMETSEDSM